MSSIFSGWNFARYVFSFKRAHMSQFIGIGPVALEYNNHMTLKTKVKDLCYLAEIRRSNIPFRHAKRLVFSEQLQRE